MLVFWSCNYVFFLPCCIFIFLFSNVNSCCLKCRTVHSAVSIEAHLKTALQSTQYFSYINMAWNRHWVILNFIYILCRLYIIPIYTDLKERDKLRPYVHMTSSYIVSFVKSTIMVYFVHNICQAHLIWIHILEVKLLVF